MDCVLHSWGRGDQCFEQCALPVLEGLLPAPHDTAILDLVFVMGCWHAYAKLQLHTEHTLASFKGLTADLGVLLRHFSTVVCNEFKTTELPKERAAKATGGSAAAGGGSKPRGFNLNTYKLHALGDYLQTIHECGTTDNYTSQRVRSKHGPTSTPAATDCIHWSTG